MSSPDKKHLAYAYQGDEEESTDFLIRDKKKFYIINNED
jgi:hypothetical protein